jgi:AAA+ superfamily predicted ATPase
VAYEDKTLKDLMDEIRKMEQPEPKKTGVFWEDILDEEPAVAEKTPSINLDVCIRDTLEDLRPYRLSAAGENIIREFLTFRVQTRQSAWDQPEAHRAYYNLLIHGEEKESIRAVADILRQALDIPTRDTLIQTEAELLQQMEAASRTPRRSKESLIPNGVRFVLIDACKDAPQMNMDGGSAVRDANRKAMENYRAMWKAVISHIRANPETILLVGCEESVYRNTMCPFIELSQRICGHHIHLIPRSEDDLLADCLAELKRSSFALSDDFEPTLAEYFHNAYRSSDLRSQAFVADLLDRIFALYYSRQRDSLTLTADCVPVFDYLTQSVESVLGQLEQLIGLETVKAEFSNIYKMQVAGLADRENSHYHMVFTGNPGTGKTTVARMAADLFHRMGVLKTNKLVAVKPSDLISEWIGGTGIKAMEVIRRAYNGVLFIDEAYGIANMDRGEELLNVLLQEMENNADKLIVILAGYTDEMRELLKTNPGLGSRIGQEIHFADYSQEELARIFLQMCKKSGFSLDDSARDELDDCIGALMTREFFGNARDIRNMLQDLKEVWSEDFYTAVTQNGVDAEDFPRVFLPHHFEKIMPPKKEVSIQDLIGLEVLKNKLDVFKRQAMYQKHLREKGFTNLSDFSMHMIFTGNPGTGKTTVAKLIADDLYSIGMLKTNRLVIAERKDLIGIRGDAGKKTADVIRKAVGGVLFIDEAYSLAGERFGNNECIEVLLTAMEEHKSDTVFIFAGYVSEMQDFMASNPGIQSRIGYTFHFEDYSPEELTDMYAEKMKKTGFVVSEDALERVREIMEYFQDVKYFGNGRFVNHVIHQTISQRASRDFHKDYRSITQEDIPAIKTLIETAPNSMHLYDPAAITPEQRYRTAIHEVGHAAAIMVLNPKQVPQSISIRSHAGSYGRVVLPRDMTEQTEEHLLTHLAILLSGKNAEKRILGTHTTGCAEDFARAKRVAQDMVEQFAMTAYGATADKILATAEEMSNTIISSRKEKLERIAHILLEEKELTGERFKVLFSGE